jgi:hypothetical protein
MDGNAESVDAEALRSLVESDRAEESFRILSDPRARDVLRYLFDHSTVRLGRLADVVAGLEATRTDAVVEATDREAVRTSLFHSVLPRLAAAGFVDFDPETRTATEGDVPTAVYAALGVTEG